MTPSTRLRSLALLAAVAALGCSSPELLALAPEARVPLELATPTVRVALTDLVDARPVAEREGRDPRSEDRGIWFVGEVEVERGSVVTGDDALGDAPLEGLESTLRSYLGSLEPVEVVGEGEDDDDDVRSDADYVLQVDILHLVAAAFRSRRELDVPVVEWFVDPDHERRFLPAASVVLRLQLRSVDGRFRASRVVNASVLGSPDEAEEPAALVASAVRAAAHEARWLVGSWLARAGATPGEASTPAGDDDSFLVHAVDVNWSGVVLARVDRQTGQVRWIERRHGLPLIGPPGVWHLSPFDEHGVLLPPAVYGELAEGLADDFGLQRVDQLAVYRYLGPVAR
jgi:hypothetical protein